MKDRHEFYCLCSPRKAKGPVGALYGTVEWYDRYRSAEFPEGTVEYERVTCPLDSSHNGAGARIGDLQLILPTPHVGDFVWTVMGECVITSRVLELFKKSGFTGFKERHAAVFKIRRARSKSAIDTPVVWELVVTGRGGDAHPDSGIRLLYACTGCGLKRYSSFRNGIIVDDMQWDGSDFFSVNGYSGFILITKRVKDFIIQSGLTNCAIIPSQNLQWGDIPRPEDFYSSNEVLKRVQGPR